MAEVADQITVQCACGKKLRAPRSAVGRKARCAKCGNVFTLQAPPPPVPKDDDGLGALYELAAEEKQASRNQVDDTPRCPQCISPLPAGGVICTNCGFNVKSGKKLQTTVAGSSSGAGALGAYGTAPAEKPKKSWFGGSKSSSSGKKAEDAMAPQGKFVVGLGVCAAGAAIGGIIWYAIAMSTGYQVGYIALLVGILAGLGMQIGQKGYSSLGGVTAAGVAALAIIVANLAVVMTVMDEDFTDTEYDERVVDMLVEEHLRAQGLDFEETDYEQDEAAYEAVEKKLDKTSEAEMKALIARAELKEQKDLLEYYVAYDIMKRMNIDPDNANETQERMALKQAKQRVDPMTAQQLEAEKKRLVALHPAIAANVAESEEEASAGSDEGEDSTAETATFVIILLLVFGWKSILFLVIAMSIAFKTAAGAVSD